MAADPETGGGRPIEQKTIGHVRDVVVDFILPHAFEFYRTAEGLTNGERLRKLASWILTSKKTEVTARDFTRNVHSLRGLSTFDLNNCVSPLVAAGWLEPADRHPINRTWTVNPIVMSQFVRQRQIEDERKAHVARLMGSPRKNSAG
jgi:hypothetical protein